MNWLEIKLKTQQIGIECLANIFHELGAGGVVIEDPQLIAFYAHKGQWDDYEFNDDLLQKTEVVVKSYLPMDQFLLEKLGDLKKEIELLKSRMNNLSVQIETHEVKEDDWANSWKAYFKPERIGQRIVIKPTWEDYQAKSDDLVIELDPGMAFGTGSHATTSLCLRLLEEYVQDGMDILDIGTGSGILSLAAAKLGAKKVQALDFDTVAVEAARENVHHNNLKAIIQVNHSDLFQKACGKNHIIVANIVSDIIQRLIPAACQYLLPEGIFIASGIIDTRKEEVIECFRKNGFLIIDILEENGWVAIVGRRR